MASNDIGDWYRSIPQITKYWFTGSIVLPLLGKVGLLKPLWLILDFYLFIFRFQIWRPVTAALYYPITPQTGFHYLMNLYFLYSYSTRLETDTFSNAPADYLFMLLFLWLSLVLLGFFVGLMLLMDPLVISVLYVWCQLNKDQVVSFWFGTRFKAMYLPWILLAFNFVLGQGFMMTLFGIVVGHFYFFLMFKYPQDFGGRQFFTTPEFLKRYFPDRRGFGAGFGQAPSSTRNQGADNQGGGGIGFFGRHRWGAGNRLGED